MGILRRDSSSVLLQGASRGVTSGMQSNHKGPKVYPGRSNRPPVPAVSPSRRRDSIELDSTLQIPGIQAGLGGALVMSPEAQKSLYFNYPPPNLNSVEQATPTKADLPRNTTFRSGYNFERAHRDHGLHKSHFRPEAMKGEIPKGMLGVAPFV